MKGVASVSNGTNGNYELNVFHVSASQRKDSFCTLIRE